MATKFAELAASNPALGTYVDKVAGLMMEIFRRAPKMTELEPYKGLDVQKLREQLASDPAGLQKMLLDVEPNTGVTKTKNVAAMAGQMEELTMHLGKATDEQFAQFMTEHGVDATNPDLTKVKEMIGGFMADPKHHHEHIEKVMGKDAHPERAAEQPAAADNAAKTESPAAPAAVEQAPPVAANENKPKEDLSAAIAEYRTQMEKMFRHLQRTKAFTDDTLKVSDQEMKKIAAEYIEMRGKHFVEKGYSRMEVYKIAKKVGDAEDYLDLMEKGKQEQGIMAREKDHFNLLLTHFHDVSKDNLHPKLKHLISETLNMKREEEKQKTTARPDMDALMKMLQGMQNQPGVTGNAYTDQPAAPAAQAAQAADMPKQETPPAAAPEAPSALPGVNIPPGPRGPLDFAARPAQGGVRTP